MTRGSEFGVRGSGALLAALTLGLGRPQVPQWRVAPAPWLDEDDVEHVRRYRLQKR